MTKKLLFTLFSLTLMLLAGCAKPPASEESCNFILNKFHRRVSWAETPIRFYVDDSINSNQYNDILKAMEIWNKQFDEPVFEMIGRTNALPNVIIDDEGETVPDGYNGIYLASADIFNNSPTEDEQARTSLSYSGDNIYEADILIDSSERFFYGSGNATLMERHHKVSFLSLMVHELGHVLGLNHIKENAKSVMFPRLNFGEYRATITDSDYESLLCEYK